MSKISSIFIICLAFTIFTPALTPQTVECNFDGANRTKVYSLVSAPGVGTTFTLPAGWEIQDFVVVNNKSWFGQSNGSVGIVKPLEADSDTAVILSTTSGHCFVFHLSSRTGETAAALAVVDIHDQDFFQARLRREAAAAAGQQREVLEKEFQAKLEAQLEEGRQRLLAAANSRYRVKGTAFQIRRVVDDGVFTYLVMPGSRERPAVFRGRSGKDKELQPVKYVDKGDYYQIHHVLAGGEKFYLKAGANTAEIEAE